MHVEQFNLEIDGRRQLRLAFAEASKFDDLTRLRTGRRGSGRPGGRGHNPAF
jgi:hypothetical protein